ncbi:methyltransferase domain-containing protein [Pandoraea fibrosis]|uniref:Methyltransferase domain-containing protein n=1 Tax=Pandoraea fibrosis TaxID=1891094 RepID=A0ABX6HSC5_9BURK|nr:class I SAM-dependent methyltransferase [Pandoraea fibrosis]QHE92632.1 methyltransferase domain-containing protein [Pandoraea fibrosis]QHF13812.1 methyltransferase domain-containing protein [Pandoraea fibrosis]
MQQDTIAMFDQHAATYDQTWQAMAPLREALQLVLDSVFAPLPEDAEVLCVGAGTGAEILYLAARHPGWRFTAVEPSGPMLDVFRRKAEAHGIVSRCAFHRGYLDSLPSTAPFDAATSILVSQFVTDPIERRGFFRGIAQRLRPGGYLASADLACEMTSEAGRRLLDVWFEMMSVNPEARERARAVYGSQVAVVPPEAVSDLIREGGFDGPVRFFQSGLIHAWFARQALDS